MNYIIEIKFSPEYLIPNAGKINIFSLHLLFWVNIMQQKFLNLLFGLFLIR